MILWMKERIHLWRAAFAALLLVSLTGPWAFDRIFVPAKYDCTRPVYRLDGDFCGVPMPGVQVIAWAGINALNPILDLFRPDPSGTSWGRAWLGGLLAALVLLPLPTTLVLTGWRVSRNNWGANLCAWGLAGAVAFLFAFSSGRLHPALWGTLLYCTLAVTAVAFELLFGRKAQPAA